MIVQSEGTSSESIWQTRLRGLHGVLACILIYWRILISSSDHLGDDFYLWHVFLILGYLVLGVEWATGWRKTLHWGVAGMLALVVWIVMLPAWWQAADPSAGVGRAIGIGGILLLAGYLTQIASTHKSIIIGSIAAGLCTQAVLALIQYIHVLPVMAEQQSQQMIGKHLNDAMQRDLAERIRNGGTYGTFALANNLGICLSVCVIMLSAFALRHLRQRLWVTAACCLIVLGIALAALVSTASKGALLALCLAGFASICWVVPRRLRYALIGLAGGATCALVILGPVGSIPSVQVRLGYWQSAFTLWFDAPWQGIGWGQFTIQNASVMPVWGEWTARVHNELLEVLTAGGIWAGFAMLSLMAYLMWPHQKLQTRLPAPDATKDKLSKWLVVIFPLVAMYAALLGTMISDNLSFWPGAEALGAQILYAGLLGLIAAGIFALVTAHAQVIHSFREPWRWLGILVIVSTALIDFHFHEYGILTVLVGLCCLGAPRTIKLPSVNLNYSQKVQLRCLAIGAFTLCIGLIVSLQLAGHRRDQIREITTLNQLLDYPELSPEEIRYLEQRFPESSSIKHLKQRANQWILQTAAQWPANETLLRQARIRVINPHHRINELNAHQKTFQPSLAVLNELAIAHAQVRDWATSLRYAKQAIKSAPWDLRNRYQLLIFYERAAPHSGPHQGILEGFVAEERSEIEALNAKVHGRNRFRLD